MKVNFKTRKQETLVKFNIIQLKKGDNILEIDNRTLGIMEKEIKDRDLKIEIITEISKNNEKTETEVIENADKKEE